MPSELEAGDLQLPPPQRPEQPAQRAAAPYVQSAIDAVWNAITGPSWLEKATEQSRRDREAYARGGVREMFKDTEATQDLAGGFGGSDIGIAGTFGGRFAHTANLDMLARAKEMLKAGAPRASIWNQTGWFQGPDKKWRFEIPDQRSTVALKKENLFGTADQVLEHPELYEAYPSLAKHVVDTNPDAGPKSQMTGGFTPNKDPFSPGYIRVNAGGADPSEQARSVLLHEMQHGVQDIEGFSQGGNLYKVPGRRRSATPDFDIYQRSAGEVEARNVQERKDFEHRQVPPWETAGVSEDMQIVGRGRPASLKQLALPRAAEGAEALHPGDIPEGALPTLGRSPGRKRALFDYSRLHEVPNVPQFALERVQPARGTPERFLKLGEDKARIAAANELVGKGTKQGGLEWYNTQQLADAWLGELGEQQGLPDFKLFIDLVSATSPEMKVPQNIRAASYYYWLMKNNKELPALIKSEKGKWKVPEGAIPAGYGARTQALHVQNVRNIAEGGGLPLLQNPKPPSFATNLTGNYQPVTIDRHNMRLFGMKEDTPGLGYDYMERMQQEQARKMGIAPAQYQASGWIGGAEQTGMLSGNQPFLRLFEDQINRTAEYMGQTPQQTLQQLVRGQIYLR